jgi:hypothetical protein
VRAERERDQALDQAPVGTAYLLHFTERYEHAGHYTGWARDLDARLASHIAGRSPRQGGARLIQVIRQAGIGFQLARTWPGVTRARERQLKQQGGASRRCPLCRSDRAAGATVHARPAATTTPRRIWPAGHSQTVPATRSEQRRAFLALNPGFARPAGAPLGTQWHRVRGREDVEVLTPRVVTARFEENEQLSQQRAATVIRCAVRARITARQQRAAEQTDRDRPGALLERTRRQLHAARDRQAHRPTGGGRQAARDDARQEADRER